MDCEKPSAIFESSGPPENQPKVIYNEARAGNSEFLNPSLIDPDEGAHQNGAKETVEGMLNNGNKNSLPINTSKALLKITYDHTEIFRTKLSKGPSVRVLQTHMV